MYEPYAQSDARSDLTNAITTTTAAAAAAGTTVESGLNPDLSLGTGVAAASGVTGSAV